MFPAHNGLDGYKSTMIQCAKSEYSYLNVDTYPYMNADLKSLFADCGDGFSKDREKNRMSTKKPLSKAERRAEHNASERARRENLNHKFLTLAQALPNISKYRRPSKNQIVEKALDWVRQCIAREKQYEYQILQLQRENKRLLAEVNELSSFMDFNHACNSTLMLSTPQSTPNSDIDDFTRHQELTNTIVCRTKVDDSGGYDDETDNAQQYSFSFISTEIYPLGNQTHGTQF